MLKRTMACSFCGRPDSEVAKLVAGPIRLFRRVYICDRCARQTIEIMQTHSGDQPRVETPSLVRRFVSLIRRLPHHSLRLQLTRG
jgi:ATP-dependent protease Clp ATPase subunit